MESSSANNTPPLKKRKVLNCVEESSGSSSSSSSMCMNKQCLKCEQRDACVCVKLFHFTPAPSAVDDKLCSSSSSITAADKQLRLFQLLSQWDVVFSPQQNSDHFNRGLAEVKEEVLKLMDEMRVLHK